MNYKYFGSGNYLACFVVFLALFIANVSSATTQDSGTIIKIMANHLPPYMIIATSPQEPKYSGFDYDLAELIAHELGVKTQYVECKWPACSSALKSGEIDIANSVIYSKSREAFLEYIQPALLQGVRKTVFFQRFNDPEEINSFNDLAGKDTVVGYIGSAVYFTEFENTDQLLKMDVKDHETGLRLLAAGKIDVLAGYREFFYAVNFKKPKITRIVKQANYSHETRMLSYLTISRASQHYHLNTAIAEALKRLLEQGEIEVLRQKWLGSRHQVPATHFQ